MREAHTILPVADPPDDGPVRRTSPCRPGDVREAVARAVSEQCRTSHASCDADALSDALLVASELTTNAILHGGGVTEVRVDVTGPSVRVSVSDRSDELPVTRTAAERARGGRRPGGHGWPIVCRLSRDVLVADLPTGGKCITAVVPLS
ncbi:ATP-binding protein [Streptomyces sp. NPDC029526]|uniref:ATP-binding protein n=1 Tax=Streptomyces sp. NPDC029526 TaxID=3155728 RepID=UPI0033F6FF40